MSPHEELVYDLEHLVLGCNNDGSLVAGRPLIKLVDLPSELIMESVKYLDAFDRAKSKLRQWAF